MKELTVIIVAGGKGQRMRTDFPKQFMPLAGRPILMRTIERFAEVYGGSKIIVAMNADYMGYWGRLCDEYSFRVPHVVCEGGERRYMSVRNALELAPDTGLIAVHDGVRPLVGRELILRTVKDAKAYGAVVPVIPLTNSIREVTDGGNRVVDRENYRLVQTPQVFDAAVLKKAYESDHGLAFTDDASVVEASGHPVWLCEGEETNIKITDPVDMIVAEALIKSHEERVAVV